MVIYILVSLVVNTTNAFPAYLPDTYIHVANALDYAKATAFAVNKDLTLLAIFDKMFPFIY